MLCATPARAGEALPNVPSRAAVDLMDRVPAWSGTIVLGAGWLLYVGPLGATTLHRHHAIQVMVARGGSIGLWNGHGRGIETSAALIPADAAHATPAAAASAFLLYVEPDSAIGRLLGSGEPSDRVADWQRQGAPWSALARRPVPATALDACRLAQAMVAAALGAAPPAPPMTRHPKVSRAIELLPTLLARGERVRVADVAAVVGLSESRLSHAFNRDAAMSVPAYLRWLRLRLVADALCSGQTLTQAAHAAGFSDSAHLSRVFKAGFGVRPSELLAGIRWQVSPLPLTDSFKPDDCSPCDPSGQHERQDTPPT